MWHQVIPNSPVKKHSSMSSSAPPVVLLMCTFLVDCKHVLVRLKYLCMFTCIIYTATRHDGKSWSLLLIVHYFILAFLPCRLIHNTFICSVCNVFKLVYLLCSPSTYPNTSTFTGIVGNLKNACAVFFFIFYLILLLKWYFYVKLDFHFFRPYSNVSHPSQFNSNNTKSTISWINLNR